MKNLIKIEELFIFGLTIFLFSRLDFAWWWYPILFFVPDLSAIGYLISPQIGAWTYNIIHIRAVSISIYVLGIILVNQPLQLAGLILFGHSSLDRALGYGLKYPDSPQHTHLEQIGSS